MLEKYYLCWDMYESPTLTTDEGLSNEMDFSIEITEYQFNSLNEQLKERGW